MDLIPKQQRAGVAKVTAPGEVEWAGDTFKTDTGTHAVGDAVAVTQDGRRLLLHTPGTGGGGGGTVGLGYTYSGAATFAELPPDARSYVIGDKPDGPPVPASPYNTYLVEYARATNYSEQQTAYVIQFAGNLVGVWTRTRAGQSGAWSPWARIDNPVPYWIRLTRSTSVPVTVAGGAYNTAWESAATAAAHGTQEPTWDSTGFIAPVNGVYSVTIQVNITLSTAGRIAVRPLLNGSVYAGSDLRPTATGNTNSVTVATQIPALAGQRIGVQVQAYGSDVTLTQATLSVLGPSSGG